MGRRGPKPSPTAVKKVRGDRRINQDEPVMPAAMPDCPDHLTGEARVEWDRQCEMLYECGILTEADRAILTVYCDAWGQYVEASNDLRKYGRMLVSKEGTPYQSPAFNIAVRLWKLVQTLSAEIGATPTSRNGVTAVKPVGNADDKADDKAEFFLKVTG